MEIRKSNYIDFLKCIKSGLALDVAKNHTGVVIWNGETVETYGFALAEYQKDDCFAEYKMRRDLKSILSDLVLGKSFEVCIIEDVYGGENFDTVRKLLALNTVIDELIFDHKCFVNEFYRQSEPVWMKNLRSIYKQTGGLRSKYETQGILEYLDFPFYLENKEKSDSDKKEMFFEDICDAGGMLLSVCAAKILKLNIVKSSTLTIKNIKMDYIQNYYVRRHIRDSRNREEPYIEISLDFRNLEKSIVREVQLHPDDVLMAVLPSNRLGAFGVAHKFNFFAEEDDGLLFFHRR